MVKFCKPSIILKVSWVVFCLVKTSFLGGYLPQPFDNVVDVFISCMNYIVQFVFLLKKSTVEKCTVIREFGNTVFDIPQSHL